MSWFDKLVDKARGYEEIKAQPHAFVGDEVQTGCGPGKVTAITGHEVVLLGDERFVVPFEEQYFEVELEGRDKPLWMQRRELSSDRYIDSDGSIVDY